MAKSHAVRTLEKKRASLKADLAHCDMVRARTLESLAHVDAALTLFREAKNREARDCQESCAGGVLIIRSRTARRT
jgi:hypothetical protein